MLTVGSLLAVATMLLVSWTMIGARAEAASRAVDQSEHESKEAREITYEEAHDLLTAFLKVRPLAVEKSGDLGYKEFYFFMADMGSLPCRPMRSAGPKRSLRWELPVLCRGPKNGGRLECRLLRANCEAWVKQTPSGATQAYRPDECRI